MVAVNQRRALLKILVFFLSLTPFFFLLYDAFNDRLGANPIETLHFTLGDWALRFLCITLALRPIKIVTGQPWPLRFRRMMGLFAFFYASLHFLVYVVLDQSLSWQQIMEEIPKSPYILIGLFAYVLLIPLALTSTKKMQKRLGKNWKKLHQLMYVIVLAAIIHFLWLVKLDNSEPVIYAFVVILLLGIRIMEYVRKKRKKSAVMPLHKNFSLSNKGFNDMEG